MKVCPDFVSVVNGMPSAEGPCIQQIKNRGDGWALLPIVSLNRQRAAVQLLKPAAFRMRGQLPLSDQLIHHLLGGSRR